MKNEFSIPCTYKTFKMRSILETRVAKFLDKLKIKWKYEPTCFMLSSGKAYIPDFYLPEWNIYIEAKGLITREEISKCNCFSEDYKKDIIILSEEKLIYLELFADGIGVSEELLIGKCEECNKIFFCGCLGSWHCKNCKTHNGDHNLIGGFNGEINSFKSLREFFENGNY